MYLFVGGRNCFSRSTSGPRGPSSIATTWTASESLPPGLAVFCNASQAKRFPLSSSYIILSLLCQLKSKATAVAYTPTMKGLYLISLQNLASFESCASSNCRQQEGGECDWAAHKYFGGDDLDAKPCLRRSVSRHRPLKCHQPSIPKILGTRLWMPAIVSGNMVS